MSQFLASLSYGSPDCEIRTPFLFFQLAPGARELRVQEQLALADRLFPVGCRITASGLRLGFSFNPERWPGAQMHPVVHIAAPVAAPRRRCKLAGAMALRHAPGPMPPPTPRQFYNAAAAANACAPSTAFSRQSP